MTRELYGINGKDIIFDPNVPSELKYPTGRKDGNRLGERKRREIVYKAIVVMNTIIMHPSLRKYVVKEPK